MKQERWVVNENNYKNGNGNFCNNDVCRSVRILAVIQNYAKKISYYQNDYEKYMRFLYYLIFMWDIFLLIFQH